ncbi:MAG TPA: histidine kinase dimerization/phospho-acceptor domain-containing protein, partial [Chryseolinea sp.]
MKIRNRLTLSFSLLVIGIFLVFSCTVYFFTSKYRRSEFNNRLKQRIEITEKIFLEKANSPDDFIKIREQFLNKLPEETEEVVRLLPDFRDSLKIHYPEEFITDLLATREAFFEDGEKQGGGKIFHVNGHDFLVLLTAVDNVGIRMIDHLITVIVIVMATCIIAIILLGHYISGTLINPILSKIRQANAISANNLHERLDVVNPTDEMGELAIAFNSLLDRVEHAFYTQKLFIDNASHEIRNPLTAIMGQAEFALERVRSTDEYIDSLKSVSHEAERLNALVNDLLQLAGITHKDVTFHKELISVYGLLSGAKDKLDAQYPDNKVGFESLEKELASELYIEGNRHLLTTAFFNLMDNATKYSSFKPVKVLLEVKPEGYIEISIHDDGIGIPENDLKNITQPFHRASNARQIMGTGIGIP